MAKERIKLSRGTVYQETDGGKFYYRYTLNKNQKAVCLQTKNKEKALKKAEELIPVVKAPTEEVVAAHVKNARGWGKSLKRLLLKEAWDKYKNHPDRARPATVNIFLRYESYFGNFVDWALARKLEYLDEVTDEIVDAYAEHLRAGKIGVDTHNKRIARVAHVFRTLKDYSKPETSDWSNPKFKRKTKEETGIQARRLPFTKKQEEEIFAVLKDPKKKRANREELNVLFHLGAHTGQRMKDCVLLQWDVVDLKRDRIRVKQFKTGKEVSIPIAPQLHIALAEAREWKVDSYVLPNLAERYQKKSKKGKDVGGALVNLDVLRVIRAAGIETNKYVKTRDRKVTVYGFHSLRHAFVSFCAEQGVSKAVVVSILGADSKIIDTYYTHVGDEAQEQAIQAISGTGISFRQKYDDALKFLEGLEEKTEDIQKLEKILRG